MSKDRMDREERKQLRGPDEFITTATSFVEWAKANSRTVITAAIGLAAVVIGVGAYNSYQAAQVREANADLASALDTYRGGEYAEAATALSDLAKRDGAAVAPLAAIVAANSRLRAGDADAAISALAELDRDSLPPYLRQQAEIAWGNALEAKGDLAAAATKYASAASSAGPFTGDAMVAQARVSSKNGDEAAAALLYKKVLDEFPERSDRLLLEGRAG